MQSCSDAPSYGSYGDESHMGGIKTYCSVTVLCVGTCVSVFLEAKINRVFCI